MIGPAKDVRFDRRRFTSDTSQENRPGPCRQDLPVRLISVSLSGSVVRAASPVFLYRPLATDSRPNPWTQVGGEYRIIDEAELDPVDRIALAGGLFLGDLSDLIIFAPLVDPRHALRLTGFDVAVCVHCGGIVRWSITGESYTGIGPLGGPVWEWVRKRHNLKPRFNH